MLKMQKFTDKKEETAPEPAVSQKEYLQRYLMKNKGKKVKKKKPKISSSSHLKRSVIIDDDVDLNLAGNVDEEAFNLDYMGDEAPQICGYTDDRPLELQLKEKFSSGNWKSIGEIEAEEQEARRVEDEKVAAARKRLESGDRGQRDSSPTTTGRKQKKTRGRSEGDDSDMSPPRKVRTRGSDSDLSPPRKSNEKSGKRTNSRNKGSDSDLSPPRGRNDRKVRRRGSDSDLSPPRKSTDKMRRRTDDRPKRGSDSDLSPPRKGRRGHSDRSPPRKKSLKSKGSDSDLSPPRKSSRPAVTKDSKRRPRHDSDSDLSPPRRQNDNRSGGKREKSPQRRNAVESDRRERQTRRRNDSDSDLSPPRKGQKHIKKLDKTLDGKTAGLQDAKRLKEELKAIKDKEDRMFKKLDANLLGKSAAPVLRDRKTGQKRDLEKEKQAAREKAEREDMRKNKYDRWGRGLKQVHEREEQMADMLHEMSKPLARYKDDADLDRLLKNRQREGDPMLDYIRNKQQESHVVDLTVDGVRAKYMGTFMPNRFNIPPGHRWDGVDRSNGYEQKWFEAKSAKVAVEEEAWKWSCADM